MALSRFDGVDAGGDLGGEGFKRRGQDAALCRGQAVEHVFIGSGFTAGKSGKARRIGQAAAGGDEPIHIPWSAGADFNMMLADDCLEFGGKHPIGN